MKTLSLIFLILAGCGHKSPGDAPKTLESFWHGQTIGWDIQISDTKIIWVYSLGGACESDLLVDGQNLIVTNSQTIGVMPVGQPSCSQFDNDWTYTLTDGDLKLCEMVLVNGTPTKVCEDFK